MSGALGIACHMSSPLQWSVCQLCKALLRIVIGSKAVGSLPHSYASKCAGRETKARYYMPYEQPLGEGARRRRRMDVPRRGTLLRSGQYDNCAKRDFVSSFRAKREIFVIRGLAVNDWKFQMGNLLSTYLRASPHIYCSEAATTTLNPEPSSLLKTLHEKPLDTAASN